MASSLLLSRLSSSRPAGAPFFDSTKARMSSLPASVTLSMPPAGIVSRILVNSLSSVSFSQCEKKPSPLSAGARSEPTSSLLWQRPQLVSNAGLPRAACASV